MEYAIEVKDLVKRYKDFVALSHFDLEVREGEIFGLLGPNGSGKTTTINCILSLLTYDQGDDIDELRSETGDRCCNAECGCI